MVGHSTRCSNLYRKQLTTLLGNFYLCQQPRNTEDYQVVLTKAYQEKNMPQVEQCKIANSLVKEGGYQRVYQNTKNTRSVKRPVPSTQACLE